MAAINKKVKFRVSKIKQRHSIFNYHPHSCQKKIKSKIDVENVENFIIKDKSWQKHDENFNKWLLK